MRIKPSVFFASAVMASAVGACSDDDVDRSASTELSVATTANIAASTTGSPTTGTSITGTATTVQARPVDDSETIAIIDPDWLAADESFVYVKLDSSKVLRLDPTTGNTLGTTVIGGQLCQGLGAAFGSVWSCLGTTDGGDVIVRIDPATDEVIATIELEKARMQGNLAGGFERIWVLGADGTQLFGIDPTTNVADDPIELGVAGSDLAVGPDAVWVVSSRDGSVVRVDPEKRAVAGRFDALENPLAIDVVADGVWIAMETSTVRLDPATLEIVATVPIGTGNDGSIDVEGNDLWIRSALQLLVRVDTTTGTEVERLSAPIASGGDVLVAAGAVWATAYDDTLLVRHAVG